MADRKIEVKKIGEDSGNCREYFKDVTSFDGQNFYAKVTHPNTKEVSWYSTDKIYGEPDCEIKEGIVFIEVNDKGLTIAQQIVNDVARRDREAVKLVKYLKGLGGVLKELANEVDTIGIDEKSLELMKKLGSDLLFKGTAIDYTMIQMSKLETVNKLKSCIEQWMAYDGGTSPNAKRNIAVHKEHIRGLLDQIKKGCGVAVTNKICGERYFHKHSYYDCLCSDCEDAKNICMEILK